jgi:hypothetical protein
MNGGDSIVTLNLAIYEVETTGIQENDVLVASAVGAAYQWLDCDNDFFIISGETDRTYTPLSVGNYAVEVIQNGCVDTSACISFAKVGIEEHGLENNLIVFPNPTTGNVTIDLGATYPSITARILDLNGQLVGSRGFTNSSTINLSIPGTFAYYLVELLVPGQEKVVVKVLKE